MTEIINGQLRMMGDRILLRPLEWDASKIIIAIRHGRAVRGEVIAVGPGCHPKKYKAGMKGRRSLMDYSKRFQPTELKPGDIVELGGLNIFDGKGYMFPEVLIGTERHIIVQEADVAIVRDDLKAPIPDPVCATEGCTNIVESSEDYCTWCLNDMPQVQANG